MVHPIHKIKASDPLWNPLTYWWNPMRGFLTGSRAWYLHSDESDTDVVVTVSDWEKICPEAYSLSEGSGSHEPRIKSLKFELEGGSRILDMIIVTDFEYDVWKFATEALTGIIGTDYETHISPDVIREGLKHKPTRIALFEALKTLGRNFLKRRT